ncbi:MAG: arylamine N-acetyltransferase family protein, partial [Stackebrandtia sp.]
VLEHAGFTVTGTLARVRMGSGQLRPTTHAALVVHTDDGDPWLADVGFGGKAGLLEPVRLADGNESAQDGWRFRVDLTADGSWILSIADGDDWLDVYSFTTQPSYPADFDIANYSASTSDRSPFTGRLIAQLTGKRTRATLLDTELTVTHADGGDEVTDYEAAELPRLLTERFGIALSENELTEITRTVSGYAR